MLDNDTLCNQILHVSVLVNILLIYGNRQPFLKSNPVSLCIYIGLRQHNGVPIDRFIEINRDTHFIQLISLAFLCGKRFVN